jgi:hypothetical protein
MKKPNCVKKCKIAENLFTLASSNRAITTIFNANLLICLLALLKK